MNQPALTPFGGIYIHVPFCLRKCLYCDFYSVTDLSLKPAFLEALLVEIASADFERSVFDTIYFGGGTPSILDPAEIGRIIDRVFSKFRFLQPVEITLEANPGTLDLDRLGGLRSAGVNRLNIGVQSFHRKNLELLGRIHTAEQAHAAVANARRAGFEEIGLDLIYGLPGQSRREWLEDVEAALAHGPDHIACYMLTVEPFTPLADAQRAGRFLPAPEDEAAELFLATSERLAGRGFLHYEISNFARLRADGSACTSRHNRKYWTHAPYLGFGPAAHSFRPPRRYWNCRDVKRYVDAVKKSGKAVSGAEHLTREQEMMEAVMLGLRTAAGIDLEEYHKRFGVNFIQVRGADVAELESQGLIRLAAGRCAPTLRGMLYINTVIAALV
jgi:oxygen-independent coproporphyrinogen-3 oxidase